MKVITQALRLFLLMTILTGILYPFLVTGLGQMLFPYKANGSLVVFKGKIVGSDLIGQKFVSEKYFWSRPSAIDYNPLPSGGSNLGPTSVDLLTKVAQRRKLMEKANPESRTVPSDLLFASGSGLDPHITPEAAKYQLERIARVRALDIKQNKILITLVEQYVEPPVFGIFGQPRVNVLKLNLALDSTLSGANK